MIKKILAFGLIAAIMVSLIGCYDSKIKGRSDYYYDVYQHDTFIEGYDDYRQEHFYNYYDEDGWYDDQYDDEDAYYDEEYIEYYNDKQEEWLEDIIWY